jgi:predicted metallopeptidase
MGRFCFAGCFQKKKHNTNLELISRSNFNFIFIWRVSLFERLIENKLFKGGWGVNKVFQNFLSLNLIYFKKRNILLI